MDKRRAHHIWIRLRWLKPWYFLALAIVSAVICVFALRANNQHMVELRDTVYAADKNGTDILGPLQELQAYVTTHMNTNLSAGNTSVYPPIQLKYTYERPLALLAVMSAYFLLAKRRNRLDTVDIGWGIGFVIVAWLCVAQRPVVRTFLIAVLITIWGLRLSWHIYSRSKGKDDDPRYRELSAKWRGSFWRRAYFSIFVLQGLLVLIVSLPVVIATNAALPGWRWLTIAGASIWLVGFVFEAIADYQLKKFRSRKNHAKVLDAGLWRYSRHPNYFGELVQWWGIGVIALQASYGWLGLAGPLTLSVLIIFVSGIPPIEKRRKDDPDYKAYQNRTSALLPLPPAFARLIYKDKPNARQEKRQER